VALQIRHPARKIRVQDLYATRTGVKPPQSAKDVKRKTPPA